MAKTRLQQHQTPSQASAKLLQHETVASIFFPNDNSKRLCIIAAIGASYYDMICATIVVC